MNDKISRPRASIPKNRGALPNPQRSKWVSSRWIRPEPGWSGPAHGVAGAHHPGGVAAGERHLLLGVIHSRIIAVPEVGMVEWQGTRAMLRRLPLPAASISLARLTNDVVWLLGS